jgi:hypothetical protein
MATVITQNINSVLEQTGVQTVATFVRSTFNNSLYQFETPGSWDLDVNDKIILLFSETIEVECEIININGTKYTIDSFFYLPFLPTFTRFIVLPPDKISVSVNVNVVAAFNPVVIEMQRTDFTYQLSVDPEQDTYVFDAGANVGEFIANTFIQIIDFEGVPNWYPRVNIYSVIGTIVSLQLSYIPPLSTPTISFNLESRLNFYIVLRITENRTNSIYRDLRFTPNKYGQIRAEISGALRSFLNLNYTEPEIQNEILTNEFNLSTGFYFSILEMWIGSSNSFPAGGADKYCIAGAFQIGDPNNGYYNKYFGNVYGNAFFPELMPQWLTQFEQPTYFYGFPFTLSFLGNSTMNYGYEDYFARIRVVQADGTIDDFDSDPFVLNDFISLSRLNIAELLIPYLQAGLDQRTKTILFRFGRVEYDTFMDAFAPITFTFKRALEQSCNTFYVRWLNTLGGWDYWLFENKIYEALNVENGNNYESYFDEISSISDFENVTFKNVSPAVQVGSNTITRNEAEGLKVLTTSPKIYWYNEDLSKWVGVIVEPGTFNIRSTKEDYFSVELTFIKPKYFNQFA